VPTLTEWNELRRLRTLRAAPPGLLPTGVACPDCGGELFDRVPLEFDLSTLPPLLACWCPACSRRHYRRA